MQPAGVAGPTLRCFIAAWPDAATRAHLEAIRDEQARLWPAARPVTTSNLHLTLAFIGALPVERVRLLQPPVDALEVDPFVWTADRLGVFRKARVLWIGGAATSVLDRLAATVRALLDAEAVRYDPKPFVPHVTLLRHCAATSLPRSAVDPVDWPIAAVRLVVSRSAPSGVHYVNAADLRED
jgi:2'-5' RNA ligase